RPCRTRLEHEPREQHAAVLLVEAAPRDEPAVAAAWLEVELELVAQAIAVVGGEQQRAAAAEAAVDRALGVRGGRERRERCECERQLHATSMRPAVVIAVPGASSCAASTATSGSSG